MRILIVGINYAPERTGIAPYTTQIARRLAKSHQVTILTGVPHYPDWKVSAGFRNWRSETNEQGVRVIRLWHIVPRQPTVLKRIAYELTWASRVAAAGLAVPSDLVITIVPALLGAFSARAIARRQGVPYGVVVQDIMGNAAAQSGTRGGGLIAGLTTSLERSALRSATSITTIHPRLASELQRIAGRGSAASVIYNWTHVRAATRGRSAARTHFGWGDDQIIALHSGNMGSKQNLEVLVDAARGATHSAPSVHFVLAGGGSQRASLERYAAGCSNVSFMNGVDDDDYIDLLQSADVLLINERPGMKEMSLPSKLTSYLYAGRPVVAATDATSATGEFVKASGGGVVTPAGDAPALLREVVRIAADHAGTERLVRRGQQFAHDNLGRDQALAAYDEWVDELVSGRPRSVKSRDSDRGAWTTRKA